MSEQVIDVRHAPLCTGHKRDGSPCRCIAVRGKTKCRLHGGNAAAGTANGNYRHGRYSKHLPTQLAARYEEARSNPRLLSLADDIAVAEARLAERLAEVAQGASVTLWQDLRQAWDGFSQALAAGDMGGMNTAFAAMRELITAGGTQGAAWEEVRKLWETRCKLVQTEVKTLQGLQQMVTKQQLMLFLGAITEAVMRSVKAHADERSGRAILREVQAEFIRLSTLEERR